MSNSKTVKKGVALKDAYPIIEEKLKSGGTVTFGPHGVSMMPLIRQGKDSVVLRSKTSLPYRNDVIFYRRPDGQFVLHRIVDKGRRGYVLCGDNQREREYAVKEEWIIGVMDAVIRNGRTVSCDSLEYSIYLKLILPIWRIWLVVRGILGKIKRKIKGFSASGKNGQTK